MARVAKCASEGARVVHVLVADATATLTGAQNLRQAPVLEVVEGVPVCGHWSEAEVVAFIRSMCSLLRQVHAAGVVHLDIKPMNILKAANEVVLIDFGASGIDGRRRGLRTGELTAWIAPELRNGEAGSAKSDVFRLGMTAQLLCGLSDNELAQLVHSGALDPRGFVRSGASVQDNWQT